jgi:serine/threonine protein kinase
MGCVKSRPSKSPQSKNSPIKPSQSCPIRFISAEYVSSSLLGRGAFSEVVRSQFVPDLTFRAVKILEKSRLCQNHFTAPGVLKEASILQSLKHENIIACYESFEDKNHYYLPLELCEGKSLWTRINTKGLFTEAEAAEIMGQVFGALEHVHEKKIVHRDVKAENVLLKEKEGMRVKLADFGSACEMDGLGKVQGAAGTVYYMAPEVFEGFYTEKADIWSCGILLYILITGKKPYLGKQAEIVEQIKNTPFRVNRQVLPFESDKLLDLLTKLLAVQESERISATEALQHPWITFYKEMRLLKNEIIGGNAGNYEEIEGKRSRKVSSMSEGKISETTKSEISPIKEHSCSENYEKLAMKQFQEFLVESKLVVLVEEYKRIKTGLGNFRKVDEFIPNIIIGNLIKIFERCPSICRYIMENKEQGLGWNEFLNLLCFD